MNRKRLGAIVALIFLCAAIGSTVLSDNREATFQGKGKLDDQATPIQIGVRSKKQKHHSKLFKYPNLNQGIPEAVASSPDGLDVTIGTPMPGGDPHAPSFDLQKFVRDLTCQADVVLVGSVRSKDSYLTDDETFIFSEYKVRVKEVIKNNNAFPLQPGTHVEVVYPGGAVLIDGRKVRAIDKSFHPLKANKEYLLFLKYIPETGAYKVFNSQGNYLITKGRFTKLTDEAVPNELEMGPEISFTNQINTAVSKGCSKEE
jgi:hypothetical protein